MTNYTVRAGIDTYVLYDEETSFATEPSSFTKTLGIINSITPSLRRNLLKIRGMSGVLPADNTTNTDRDVKKILPGKFEGSISVDFIPLDFGFLKYVFGSVSGTGTSSDLYNYPKASASTDAEKLEYLNIPSIAFITNYRFGGTGDNADKAWMMLGAKINSWTISGKMGEAVSCSIEAPFAKLLPTATLATPIALPSNEPFHFTGVSIEIPESVPVNEIIDDFELTYTGNIEMLYGLGSDTPKASVPKDREFIFKITLTAEGSKYMDLFTGDSAGWSTPGEIASIVLTLTGDTDKMLKIHLLRCKIDEPSISESYPEVVKTTLTIHPEIVYCEEQTSA